MIFIRKNKNENISSYNKQSKARPNKQSNKQTHNKQKRSRIHICFSFLL